MSDRRRPPAPSSSALPELRSSVRERRLAQGLSQTDLAVDIGISRQSLAAIEAGRSVPSTALSLRLAERLGVRVEDLFSLATPSRGLPVTIAGGLRGPARVLVGRVRGRWVAHGLGRSATCAADGILDADGLSVEIERPPEELGERLLVAGCAPLLGLLAARSGASGRTLASGLVPAPGGALASGLARWIHAPSGSALRLLAEGLVHIAGLHLRDRDSESFNEDAARRALPGERLALVRLAGWRQGLVLRPDDGRASLSELLEDGARIARRQPDAGASEVLAAELARLGWPGAGRSPEAGRGGSGAAGPEVFSHEEAAFAVRFGAADGAVVIEPIAEATGLRFLPLSEERFDLVLRAEDLDRPAVTRLFDELSSAGFRREARLLGPYELGSAGDLRLLGVA